MSRDGVDGPAERCRCRVARCVSRGRDDGVRPVGQPADVQESGTCGRRAVERAGDEVGLVTGDAWRARGDRRPPITCQWSLITDSKLSLWPARD